MFEKLLNIVDRYLVPVLIGIFMLRAGFLVINGLDLIGDESYYWDWSRRPDWCYYSKPPMVAWLIAAFTGVGGDYAAVVRLPAAVLGTVFLGFSYLTTKAFYTPKAAALVVLLMLAMPFNVLVNFLMTIDSPLYCFWMMSLYYLRRALFDQNKTAWFWAGVTSGAAILSKQVALLMPLMLICFLLLDKQRKPLFNREFLLYVLPVMLCLIPVALWNQQHDWIMFSHSKAHFGMSETVTLTTRLAQAGAFVLYQLILVSPVVFVLILIMTYKLSIGFNQLSQDEQFLMLMGPVLLIGILLLSLVQKVQGNWSIPFYFSAVILLSGQWLAGAWQQSLKIGIAVGFLMALLTYALPVLIPRFNLQNTAIDPTYRFRHWKTVAETIALAHYQALPDTEKRVVIALGHRTLTSELAFYLPGQPTVYHYEDSGQIASQYEVWGWPEEVIGKSAFIVSEQPETKVPDDLKSIFQSFQPLGTVANPTNANTISYYLFLGEKLRAIPNNQKQSR